MLEVVTDLRLDHPDAMQFVARQILIDVAALGDVLVLVVVGIQFIAVVGHQHLALAQQFHGVAVQRAVEHVDLIVGHQAVKQGIVVAHLADPPHPALRWIEHPDPGGFLDPIDGHVQQVGVAGLVRR